MGIANLELDPTVLTPVAGKGEQPTICRTVLLVESIYSDTQHGGTGMGSSKKAINGDCEFIVRAVDKQNGTIIKTMGNSLLAEFSSPVLAVQAAVEMQRQSEANQADSSETLRSLRIGIYSLADDGSSIELFGNMVGAAASITKHAISGQILISSRAYQEVSKQPAPHCSWSRALKIDGNTENEDLFEVTWREARLKIPSRYEVLSEVGKGGMGIVHKVHDRETGEILALKILKPEIAGEPAMQENLKREVCLARKVTHKNVCRIHEFNRSNGTAFISMEFVQGESLQSMLHRVGPLTWEVVVPIALQICAGLREAHLQGIVHRDLKPANIMVDPAGSVKVMDFGIARLFQGTGQLTGTMIGTPAYMAPEQLELKRVDARTDIYALGLLLYEMVTGSQPFVGDTPIAVALKHLREIPQRPREVVPSLPAHAEAVIMKCLQKDPAKRYQSANELMVGLNRVAGPRPAISHWNCFVADLRGFGLDIHRAFQAGAEAVGEFMGRQDWRALSQKPLTKKIAAGLGAACLLAAVIGFSVHGSQKSRIAGSAQNTPAMTEANQEPNPQSSATFTPVKVAPSTAITGFSVDLNKTSSRTTENNPPAPRVAASAPSISHAAPAEPKVVRTQKNTKSQTGAHLSAASSSTAQPSVVPAVENTGATDESKTENAAGDSAASRESSSVFASPYEGVTTDVNRAPAGSQGFFLEVGSFKDSTWADQAVAKLTQLGFQSFSVHKAHLWVQSYQVRVGPYANQESLEEARKNLVLQGFKPHPVK